MFISWVQCLWGGLWAIDDEKASGISSSSVWQLLICGVRNSTRNLVRWSRLLSVFQSYWNEGWEQKSWGCFVMAFWGKISNACALDVTKPASVESLLSHLLEQLATPRGPHVKQCNEELSQALLHHTPASLYSLDVWPLANDAVWGSESPGMPLVLTTCLVQQEPPPAAPSGKYLVCLKNQGGRCDWENKLLDAKPFYGENRAGH